MPVRCGGWVHDVRPDLFLWRYCAFRHGVVRHPGVGLAAGYEAEDDGDEPSRDRSDNPDRDVGLVTLIGQDLDAQGRAFEHDGVLVPVQQGLPD
jgi:hypothetical protein